MRIDCFACRGGCKGQSRRGSRNDDLERFSWGVRYHFQLVGSDDGAPEAVRIGGDRGGVEKGRMELVNF